jgi:succinylglutamate desuccinylase
MLLLLSAIIAMTTPLHRVAVVGGTHGNEFTGIYILEKMRLRAAELAAEHPSLAIETVFANPAAHAANRRFIDDDLNRQFVAESLAAELPADAACFEARRAREIDALIGPKGSEAAASVCIDMHTTTANMGCTIIVSASSSLAIRAAAYVHAHWEAECAADDVARSESDRIHHPLRVLVEQGTQDAAGHLASVATDGVEIEVGPTPQGVVRADVVASTERALRLLLRFLELQFSGVSVPLPESVPAYEVLAKVPFVDGALEGCDDSLLPGAVVAPSLQDADFSPLHEGEPLFEALNGTVVTYDGSLGDPVYPVFINEAAYYYRESGRGVGMSRRVDEWPVEGPHSD